MFKGNLQKGMRGMYKKYNSEVFVEIALSLVIIYVLAKIFVPIINPASVASDISSGQKNVYELIIDKSNSTVGVLMDEEDEDKKGLFTIIFKYVTNIDLDSPKSYLASQIPILQLIDITSIASEDSGPVVIVPNEGNTKDIKDNQGDKSDKTTPIKGNEINPGKIEDVKKKKIDPSKPLILIYHTHTTENYNPNGLKDQNFTHNFDQNICKVGENLKNELETKYGIATIHDTTVHDVPKRGGAYTKSRPTIQSYLKKYPGLKIIIDLHRDGDVSREKETAIISNKRYARVMFVAGTKFKSKDKNLKLVDKLNDTFSSMYPGFCRGIDYRKNSIFNQDLSGNMVLIEVGSNENSLDEAINSVEIISRVLAKNI